MSIARVWACRYSKWPPRRGGHFEYRHVRTRAIGMPSAMPRSHQYLACHFAPTRCQTRRQSWASKLDATSAQRGSVNRRSPVVRGIYTGIADGMSIARVWVCRYSKSPPRRGGHFEYRHAHTRAMDMPSAMPICSYGLPSNMGICAGQHGLPCVEGKITSTTDILDRPAGRGARCGYPS